jgi:hypothetical protein
VHYHTCQQDKISLSKVDEVVFQIGFPGLNSEADLHRKVLGGGLL